MKVSKAIEILRGKVRGDKPPPMHNGDEALKLGIEALKELQLQRKYPQSGPKPKLRGETPEDDAT